MRTKPFEPYHPADREAGSGTLVDSAERRRHRRIPAHIPIRVEGAHGREHKAVIKDLSVSGAALAGEHEHVIGDRITLLVPDLGRIPATMKRANQDGFSVKFRGGKWPRVALADKLTVLLHDHDGARSPRLPVSGDTVLEFEDETLVHATVTDVSKDGASLDCAVKPDLGENVLVGRKRGRVVRHREGGIGVSFGPEPLDEMD
ncbi:MAG: PilZ domain-containing protein [Pseudomonadota bacterium]